MSIFSNFFGKKDDAKEFNDLVSTLKTNNTNNKYDTLINYIASKKYASDFPLLDSDQQYHLLFEMTKNIDKIGEQFHIDDIIDYYNVSIVTGEDEEINTFLKIVKSYSDSPNLFRIMKDICSSFDKSISVYYIYNELLKHNSSYYKYIYAYIREGRQYNIDENIFITNIKNLITKISMIPTVDEEKIDEIITNQLRVDMHLAGGYDIDEARLVDIEKRIDKTDNSIEGVNEKIHNLDKEVSSIELKTITVSESAMKSINDYTHRKTNELEKEVERLSGDANRASKRIKSDLEVAISEINKAGETWISLINSAPVPKETNSKKANGPTIITRGIKTGDARLTRPIDTPILTRNNYDQFIRNKDQNEYYHPAFDELLDHASNMEATMLIGPHGCGKTHMVKQLSSVTGLRFFNLGFVSDEYSLIKGYMDANGNFVAPPFYEVFKYGGIVLFDEVDASESKALIELNKIVSGPGEYDAYEFANNEVVEPHPNFYLVSAANTWGDGRNRVYSTREKLDPGTLDRYEPIEMYYDEELEKFLLKKYPEMYQFIMSYRHSLEQLGIPAVISTRGIQTIKNYLDRNKSIEQILDKRFIRNLSIDELNRIAANMKDCPSNLLDNFKTRIKTKVR